MLGSYHCTSEHLSIFKIIVIKMELLMRRENGMIATIPAFPAFRDLTLDDKLFIDALFMEEQPQISELSFGSLFMWRDSEPVQLSRINETVLMQSSHEDGNLYLLPPLGKKPLPEVLGMLKQVAFGRNHRLPLLYGISATEAEELSALGMQIEPCRHHWDYVYLSRDLAELPGDKYHAKRNFITRCLSQHRCEYSEITPSVIDQCLQLETKWCRLCDRDEISGLIAENRAIKQLFEHYQDLGVFGGVIYVDGTIEAFAIAERLNHETAVIHAEKANPEIKGLYQVINQWFCQKTLLDFKFVNREQDLGIPGLRKAKMSYHPHHMVEKYIAHIVDNF